MYLWFWVFVVFFPNVLITADLQLQLPLRNILLMKLVAKGWLIDTEFLLPVAFPDANQEFSCWVDGFVECLSDFNCICYTWSHRIVKDNSVFSVSIIYCLLDDTDSHYSFWSVVAVVRVIHDCYWLWQFIGQHWYSAFGHHTFGCLCCSNYDVLTNSCLSDADLHHML